MRKMASIQRIEEINPIPDADAIEVATVEGWKVVVQKGLYEEGDFIVYCEIDSWIPNEIAPFLSKGHEPREYEGIKGERLKTIKLRKQISQGLILPISVLNFDGFFQEFFVVGDDVSEVLNIKKYDPPMNAQLAGIAKGNFPSFVKKTDQERVQNLKKDLNWWIESEIRWEITEKLDGSSMTVYCKDDEVGVCSRNWDLEYNPDNSFWKAAIENNLVSVLENCGMNIALQGELIGEGVQNNPYKLKGLQFKLFDIWDIDAQCYFNPYDRHEFSVHNNIPHTPLIVTSLPQLGTNDIQELLATAEGKSKLNDQTEREGLVFKSEDGQYSFKVISNKFLLKQKD